jgi:hypothetical protein
MRTTTKISHLPPRLAAGSFILNAGLTKFEAGDEMAKELHATAAHTYPFFENMDPATFAKVLAMGEVALGGALLTPMVSSRLAGVGLGAFSGALLGLYMNTPGMRRQSSIRPTRQGTALAKDVWLLGIALGLVLDSGRKRARCKR